MPHHSPVGTNIKEEHGIIAYPLCEELCNVDEECEAFTYHSPKQTCKTFTKITNTKPLNDWKGEKLFTGFKDCIKNMRLLKRAAGYDIRGYSLPGEGE